MSDPGLAFYAAALGGEDRARWQAAAALPDLGGEIALVRVLLWRELAAEAGTAGPLKCLDTLTRLVALQRQLGGEAGDALADAVATILDEIGRELWPGD